MNTTPDGLVAPELSHAFMGFSIYEDVLLPVYDLGRCLEKFAAEGLDEHLLACCGVGHGLDQI
jgi:hypothetical protein